jgi:uncharacterized membrane protein YraQ (UPF0718 family)
MIKKLLRSLSAGWIFLLGVLIIYLTLGIISFPIIENALLAFLRVMGKILPILAVVFGLMFLSNLFLQEKGISSYLGQESGLKGWLIAIFSGILSSGPIYMWYPLLGDLKEKGMRTSLIAAFLYNRAVKIPLLPVMIYYFGGLFTLVLTGYMITFSIVNGLMVGRIGGERK